MNSTAMQDDLFRVKEEKKRFFRIKRSKRQQWVEGSFIAPDISDEQAQTYAETDGFISSIFSYKHFIIAFLIVMAGLSILLIRATQLQVVKGAYYRDLANSNRLRLEYVRADRGLIYDRFKIPLVQNVPNYVVTVQASLLAEDREERETLLTELYTDFFMHYLDDSLADFLARIQELRDDKQKKDKDIVLAQLLKHDHAIMLQIKAQDIPAFKVDLFSMRKYLNEGPVTTDEDDTQIYPPVKSASHLLGYLTPLHEGEYKELRDKGYLYNDVIGRVGLESYYEEKLRGQNGLRQIEVDALGSQKQVLAQEDPQDGVSVVTSLDIEFQRAIEGILQRHLTENQKNKGSVVILNPLNGEVLSLVSLPTFNNNDFARGIDVDSYRALIENENNPLFNRAISGEYPSGSIFKPIVASAALQEGIVTPNTSFLSVGGIRINVWFFPDWRAGGHGQTNIYKALSDSVNTYFYTIGGGYGDFEGLGVARISEYARQFGLSNVLEIDLPGEKAGFLPSKEWKEEVKNERWYIGDTYHLAIGQGDILVTPLQVASYMSVFANGGTLYQPHIVKAFVDKDFQTIDEVAPYIINQDVVDSEHIEVVRTGLRRVVTMGSGKRLNDLPVKVSGKTGTAQWHSTKDPHAWFAGYAPTDNPQIAFSVMVEEGEEGSGITVSITREILQWWYENRYEFR